MSIKKLLPVILFFAGYAYTCMSQTAFQFGKQEVAWDSISLMLNGHRIMPVMGEMHFTRVPANEWAREIRKIKEGGVNIVSTYIFWNHIEEEEGKFDWKGNLNLRRFIEICRNEHIAVVLRIGPFCNGEVRNGGLPDWLYGKKCKLRTEDSVFLKYTRRFYAQIYGQAKGLLWKDGGPVIGIQLDNEYTGPGSYLVSLKKIAREEGLVVPFYTRTNWHQMKSPVPKGEMIPMNSDYPDGFWESGLKEGSGNYYKAFNFSPYHKDGYPFFTCEQGGGMVSSYSRRMWISPMDIYSISLVKLGSGCNLIGYYMYHGGTNYQFQHNASQQSDQQMVGPNSVKGAKSDRRNNMQILSYDYQAPIGEFGQLTPVFYELRPLHLFLQNFGESLAGMAPYFPQISEPQTQGIDNYLRWTYRTDGRSAYVFVNNYERFGNLTDKHDVKFDVLGVKFPSHSITIPAGTGCIFPVKIRLGNINLDYATAQLVAHEGNKYYFQKLDSIEAEFSMDGTILTGINPSNHPIYQLGNTEFYLINEYDAQHLFLKEKPLKSTPAEYTKVKKAGPLRVITKGWMGAQGPSEEEFQDAAIYSITLPTNKQKVLLDIEYEGDIARLYAGDTLIDDNFYNGRHFQYDLSRLPASCTKLTLRVLPVQQSAPILFPREATIHFDGQQAVERVNAINLISRHE